MFKHDKKALVTGGSKGIGKAIVESLYKSGVEVWYVSRNPIEVDFIYDYDGELHHVKADLTSETMDLPLFEVLEDVEFDIVVNNFALNESGEIKDKISKQFEDLIFANCTIPLKILEKVKISENGKVVNISSVSGQFGLHGKTSYCASKHALNAITKNFALENPNLCVNSVSPGPIETNMTNEALTKKEKSRIQKLIPKARLGTAQEVANLVIFLVSDMNTYITGQDIIIDGGLTTAWWHK